MRPNKNREEQVISRGIFQRFKPASLVDGKVLQNPASASSIPGPNLIPIAEASGKLHSEWMPESYDMHLLEESYKTLMSNERHSSDRRGFEIR
jgi:hypothetical protein